MVDMLNTTSIDSIANGFETGEVSIFTALKNIEEIVAEQPDQTPRVVGILCRFQKDDISPGSALGRSIIKLSTAFIQPATLAAQSAEAKEKAILSFSNAKEKGALGAEQYAAIENALKVNLN